ncbi:MAG: DMT family transporter [Actinomycetota bacterium]|nr:DMT family transporter [Actinomycetota bacterium]
MAAAGVGSLTAVQSRANGSLGTILDSGLHASVVSFAVGLTVLTLVGLAVRRIRFGMVRLLAALRFGAMPWWWATGGVFGALFIFSQSFAVGIIGVALFAVALVSGQNLASLIVDAVGLGPRGRQPVSVVRMASSMIGIVAVGVAVSGRAGEDSLSAPAVALCVIAGIGVAVQQALNGRLTTISREPMAAAWANFAVGSFILTLALLMITATGARALEPLPAGPWWLYLGGIIGATFIATTAWVVGKVGVLAISLLVTAGQLTGALVLDVVDGPLIAGALLSFGAVALTAVGTSRNRSSFTPDTP